MGLGDLLAKVEKGISRLVVGRSRDPLRIQKDILDDVESKTEPVGNQRRTFPYNALDVYLLATNDDERARLESAFAERGRLESLILDKLRRVGSDTPSRLTLNVQVTGERAEHWTDELFHIEYRRAEQPKPSGDLAARAPAAAAGAKARFVVLQGTARETEFIINKPRINVGRLVEIKDGSDRVVRRNEFVFPEDADSINQTVSRAHAHISYDESAGEYRLHDDQSKFGTRIFRDGANIDVYSTNTRGNRLAPGDEVYFGQACVRFEVGGQGRPQKEAPAPRQEQADASQIGPISETKLIGSE
jgi:FHA domain